MSAATVPLERLETHDLAQRWLWYARHGAPPVSLGGLKEQVFTCPEVPGMLTYRASGRCWLVAGDPLCQESDQAALVGAFLARAMQERRVLVFLPVSRAVAGRTAGQFRVGWRVAQRTPPERAAGLGAGTGRPGLGSGQALFPGAP